MTATPQEIAEETAAERTAQGLDPKIRDPRALMVIARLVHATPPVSSPAADRTLEEVPREVVATERAS